jgi:hypothetical protein
MSATGGELYAPVRRRPVDVAAFDRCIAASVDGQQEESVQ